MSAEVKPPVQLKHLTHPQIHIDYYEWLNKLQADPNSFEHKFMLKHSKSFADFHAIAMWVWSRSRESIPKQ